MFGGGGRSLSTYLEAMVCFAYLFDENQLHHPHVIAKIPNIFVAFFFFISEPNKSHLGKDDYLKNYYLWIQIVKTQLVCKSEK